MSWLLDGIYPVAMGVFLLLFGLVDANESDSFLSFFFSRLGTPPDHEVTGTTVLEVKLGEWNTLSYPSDNWKMQNPFDPSTIYEDYYDTYGKNGSLEWVLQGPPNSTITLQVLRLRTEDCCDFLVVYSGDRELANYSGSRDDEPFVHSYGSTMKLIFKSDEYRSLDGFLLRYTATGPYDEEITDAAGSFTTTNHMGIHNCCQTTIRTREGSSVEFHLDEVQLEEGSVLQIINGRSNLSIYPWSIPQLRNPFLSDTNELILKLEGLGMYNGTYVSFLTGDCGFTFSLCGWRSVDVLHAWKRDDTGFVYFKDIPGYTLRGYRALLQSPRLVSRKDQDNCVILTYHMSGFDLFELNLYIMTYKDNTSSHLSGGYRVWQKYGESSVGSVTEVIPYTANGSYTLLLEAVRGYGPDYTFIVDDIKLQSDCTYEKKHRTSISCPFDDDLCGWQQSRLDNNNWQFQKELDNWYIMTSFGYKTVEEGERTSVLESPFLSVSEPATLGFYYSIQGQACLTVQLLTNSTTTVLWSKCSPGINDWVPELVVLPVTLANTTKVLFVAKLTSDADVVSLDELTIARQMQENFPVWSCNFTDTCGLAQGEKSTGYWLLNSNAKEVDRGDYPSFRRFRCGGGLVIPMTWRCNLRKDCPDGADEVGCGSCPPYLFRCPKHPQACIPKTEICNGHRYTVYNSQRGKDTGCGEEERCHTSRSSCRANQYECRQWYAICLESKQIWDGDTQCSDSSDERNRQETLDCPSERKIVDLIYPENSPFYTNEQCPEAVCPLTGKCVPYSCLCTLWCGKYTSGQICARDNKEAPSNYLQVKLPLGAKNILHTASFHTTGVVLRELEYMCVSFQYLVRAVDKEPGPTLRLYRDSGLESWLLWSQTGQRSDHWLHAAVLVPFMGPISFSFRFESQMLGYDRNAMVALGDLVIQRGNVNDKSPLPCADQMLGAARFENTFGMWNPERLNIKSDSKLTTETKKPHQSDPPQWVLVNSIRDLRQTGPVLPPRMITMAEKDAERLLGDAAVFGNIPSDGYLLCNSSRGYNPSYLWSLPLPTLNGLCVTFHYYMYGKYESELNVGILDESHNFRSLSSLRWNMIDDWQEAVVNVQDNLLPKYTNIVFRCNTFSSTNTDIALDNIRITKGPCGQNNVDLTVNDIISAMQGQETDLTNILAET